MSVIFGSSAWNCQRNNWDMEPWKTDFFTDNILKFRKQRLLRLEFNSRQLVSITTRRRIGFVVSMRSDCYRNQFSIDSSSGILLNQCECFRIFHSSVSKMSYRSHTAAPSRVFDHLYDPIFTTSDPKNVYKENCIALTRSAPINVYPVYKSMFSELSREQRNCYAYQKNELPHFFYGKSCNTSANVSVTGADRSKFFSNPLGNVRTINIGLMAEERIESIKKTQIIKYRTASIQTTYRWGIFVEYKRVFILKYLTTGNLRPKLSPGYQKYPIIMTKTRQKKCLKSFTSPIW